MPVPSASITLGVLLAAALIPAHAAEDTKPGLEGGGSLYLKCNNPNDPDGLNDLFIDLKRKTITDNFGTTKPFREEGPLLIADTYVDESPKKTIATSTRVNRFTLEATWLSPALKIHKTSKCSKVDRQL